MSFSTLIFIAFFLPCFLLVFRLASRYPGADGQRTKHVLLIFSLAFYLFSGLGGLLILLLCALTGWLGGRLLQRSPRPRQAFFLVIALLLAILAFFKYAGFYLPVTMPLGLSFYIFKIISYTADIYTGKAEAEKDFKTFLLYVVCFHHVAQGPILRYEPFRQGLENPVRSSENLAAGIVRFSLGLAKKVILADQMGSLTAALLPLSGDMGATPTLGIWMGSLLFSLQMYLDFSAYTDMALGLGQMAGLIYPENFDYPYCATSIRQFWRKWHISLSFFFRDYVYIPLGGNRKGKGRTFLNLLIVWLLTGIWHGATWNFILWGLYYFLIISLENLLERHPLRLPAAFRHVYVIFVFNLGWILFRFTDLPRLGQVLKGFFGISGQAGFSSQLIATTLYNNIFIMAAAVLCCTPLPGLLWKKLEKFGNKRGWSRDVLEGGRVIICMAALILAVIIMAGSHFQPFLYNNF